MTRKELLDQKLPKEYVMQRKQGNAMVDYIGGWTVIENANRIFGYQGWQFQLEDLQEVEHSQITKDGKEGWRIAYIARGTVTLFAEEGAIGSTSKYCHYSDVGFGNAVSYQNVGDAVESAVKEAATDCMKRCMRFMGNQFGLALYDKQQRNVENSVPDQIRIYAGALPPEKLEATTNSINTYLSSCKVAKLEGLTYEQCSELFELIKQLNGEGANEYAKAKKA